MKKISLYSLLLAGVILLLTGCDASDNSSNMQSTAGSDNGPSVINSTDGGSSADTVYSSSKSSHSGSDNGPSLGVQ